MTDEGSMNRLNVILNGVVQGVGYRYYVVRRAVKSDITGWVKNCSDGTMEIEAIGEKGALESFLSYVRVGPTAAHVTEVNAQWFTNGKQYEKFDVHF